MSAIRELEKAVSDGQKIQAAKLLVERDYTIKGEHRKTLEEVAEEVGVTRQTLYNWKTSDILFVKLMEAYSEVYLSQFRSEVDGQLMKLIRGENSGGTPSVKAVEMYYKLAGRLTERSEVVQVSEEEQQQATPISDEELSRELAELQSRADDILKQ